MKKSHLLSNKFIIKIGALFLIIILTISVLYIFVTFFLLEKFYSQTTQRLNANVAAHLIEEKFKKSSPFLEDGEINTVLFDDIMHDMMAVNRAIEVYLLNDRGGVMHSLVLDHSNKSEPKKKVDLAPVKKFIANNEIFIQGDDPKTGDQKIFSAAPFKIKDKCGYIYVILASESYENVCKSIFKGYFSKLTFVTIFITMLLSVVIGWIFIIVISKNLLTIIYYVNRFKEGDLDSRIPNAKESNLSILATTFNEMANTISMNINEIQSINKFKKELIANVSHDLRSPLTIIRGYAETLKDAEQEITEKNRKEFLNIIEDSAISLSNLVNRLFDYSNLDANQMHLNKTEFCITELILEITKRYSIITENKKIEMYVFYNTNCEQFVFADKNLIERVIQNLLENAIKYTPREGKVFFYIEKNQAKDKIIIKIKDTGPGISLQEQKFIFSKYFQTGVSSNKNGVGLGLAIVKKITDLHNIDIKIYCESNEKGFVFEFYLPTSDFIKK
ncbi:HAMP domain-containing sensor histidine kinase [Tenacibaculum sp. M341]|uniref:HAMP domain-containing sensor histidine kinase n=1 Tax=Tenacibaculum sp. M341 TaxID=2530339 RepID=UPI00104446ED|nr:sensor histidine kinase [Tenacibaculum sp. M341]TCI91029.1 HAMP domain-containing protein [Tenacibaculum sp. M341]